MAAGSETQFQAPGIQATGYTPTHYTPISINVPTGAGQLWAGVGDTAMKAAGLLGQTEQMMQQSPYNPAVKAQMQEAQARAQVGSQISQYAATHPGWRRAVGSESPAGASIAAPATLPVSSVTQWDLDQYDDDGTKKNPPPPPPPPPTTEPAQPAQPSKESKPKSHQEEMSQVSPPGSTLAASTTNDYLLRMRAERNNAGLGGSDAAQEGTPASMTFVNPATGNVEPYKTDAIQPAAQPAQPQGGSIWSPQRPSPAAPPAAPSGQPTPSTPGTVPGSLSDQYAQQAKAQDMNLAAWQNQNQTEPMTADDAMKWIRRKTTLAQDATYLPHGGPPGPDGQPEPAYAFHMKGGGINTVPISQMVKDGGGPTVAAQNTSAVLSQTDRLAQQKQNALAAPPDQSQQPNISPPPPANLPPPAPTGQPQTAQAQPQYPNISGPPPAPVPGAYDPTAYRQGIAQAIADPRNLMAQTSPAGQPATTAAAPASEAPPERTQVEATRSTQQQQTTQIPTPPEEIQQINSDRKRVWHPDDTGRFPGTSFTSKPSGRAGFFEQRYYRGSPGWEDGLWTAENQKRQEVLDTYGSANSGIPRSEMLDFDDVKGKSMPEIDALLAKAVWWKTHTLSMDQGDQNRLNAEANASKAYQTLLDMSQWTKENSGDTKGYNIDAILKATEAATRDGIMTKEESDKVMADFMHFSGPKVYTANQGVKPEGDKTLSNLWDVLQRGYHDVFAGTDPKNPFAYAVGSKIQDLTQALSLLPEYGERAKGDYDWPTHIAGINIPDWHIALGVPVPTNPSKIPEINSMVTGSSPDEAARNYKEMKRRVDEQYIKDVQNFAYGGKRVSQADIDNMMELSKENGKIKDDNNPMRDRTTGKLINPYDPGHHATATASPTPSPTPVTGTGSFTASRSANASPTPTPQLPQIRTYDTREFDRLGIKKGDQYLGPDGITYTRGQ